jgi:hypothetical protein
MVRVCPMPSRWDEVYKELIKYSKQRLCSPPVPPIPLILGGWAYSNDEEKMERWRKTSNWAIENGCAELAEIADKDFYKVENPTNYAVGPAGGPMYRPWDSETKPKCTSQETIQYLQLLRSRWSEIVGNKLAEATMPFALTGAKGRRLLVSANFDVSPPWGTWTSLSNDETQRSTFTSMRKAVNHAIQPHEVDHIDFMPMNKANERA